MKTPRGRLCILLGAAAVAVACGGNTATTTSPSTTASSASVAPRLFTATVPVNGASFYSFTLASPGTVELTLVSVVPVSGGAPLGTIMGLGEGAPNGTGCDLTNEVRAAPGLTAQLKTAMAIGTYCVTVFDVGNLKTPVSIGVRIVTP